MCVKILIYIYVCVCVCVCVDAVRPQSLRHILLGSFQVSKNCFNFRLE